MIRNATASWSGYLHQGKLGIFVALRKINELLESDTADSLENWKVEYESAEDFDIKNGDVVDSRHQVKAKQGGKYPNDYYDVLAETKYNDTGECIEGFDIRGTEINKRYLHTIVEVNGFGLSKKEFQEQYPGAKFVANPNNLQLYSYPDEKKFCCFLKDGALNKFCLDEIKKILKIVQHNEQENDAWKEGILDNITVHLDEEIRKKHNEGKESFPALKLSKIYDLIISNDKYKKANIHSIREEFSKCWIEFINELDEYVTSINECAVTEYESLLDELSIGFDYTQKSIVESIIKEIYSYDNDKFYKFLININPDENEVGTLDSVADVARLFKKDNIKYVFMHCLIMVKKSKFETDQLGYMQDGGYLLTAISKPKSRVRSVVEAMMNNDKLTKAMFNKEYLINKEIDDINTNKFFSIEHNNNNNWGKTLKITDKFFTPNIKFISVEKAINNLNRE